MRLFFISCCAFLSAHSVSAEPINYKDTTSNTASYSLNKSYAAPISNGQYIAPQTNTVRYVTNARSNPVDTASKDYDLKVGVDAGYRTSELKWNIAGNLAGTSPNILSELKWRQINGYEFQPKVDFTQKTGKLKGLNLQASVNKSITTTGDNQDSDYAGDNRTGEFSRSNNDSDAGHAEGFSASIGYSFDFNDSHQRNLARFTALVGYAMQNQTFVMRDGVQTIPATGPYADLRSKYDMELRTPFIGAEITSNFSNIHHLKLRGQYARGTYDGTGNWNLRNDFNHPDSFKQSADGSGYSFTAEYGMQFSQHMQLTLSSTYNYFKTDSGVDTTYLANGTNASTRFNEARWRSINYMAGLNYKF